MVTISVSSTTILSCNNADSASTARQSSTTQSTQIGSSVPTSEQKSNGANRGGSRTGLPSLDYREIEGIDSNWPGPESEKMLIKRGFELKNRDSSHSRARFIYVRSNPAEEAAITSVRLEDGARIFDLDYHLTSEVAYNGFVRKLGSSRYKLNKPAGCYSIFMGTYESLCIRLNGRILGFYSIVYSHYQGKEISDSAGTGPMDGN